jgi:hypothetical protein
MTAGELRRMVSYSLINSLLWFLVLSSCDRARAQEVDEATKAWALKRAYQLNGDSMSGCRMRADAGWSCRSIDLSGEVLNAQFGPKPAPLPPAGKK